MAWPRPPSRSGGRRGRDISVLGNDWFMISPLKTLTTSTPTTETNVRARSASIRPRLAWASRPRSASFTRQSFVKTPQPRNPAAAPKLNEETDGIVVTTDPQHAACPSVYRNVTVREANPERLDLDRRQLAACPVLHDETGLRLLNLEHNSIEQIANLHSLPNLIFLDLYDNQLRQITGLQRLPMLRVLMLGKNLIRRIENLNMLTKLDVLDLHSNLIEQVSGLEALGDLRVLNLAGNAIARVCNLSELVSLTELNLRRNKITSLDRTILTLKALSRLFLSHNQITAISSVGILSHLRSLTELSLDGNPIAVRNTFYRLRVLEQFPTLKIHDGRRVIQDKRRLLTCRKLEADVCQQPLSPPSHPQVLPDEQAIATVKLTQSRSAMRLAAPMTDERTDDQLGLVRASWMQRAYPNATPICRGYYELLAKKTHLSLYGPCLDLLLSGRFAGVSSMSFQYVDFNSCASYFVSIRDTFSQLRSIVFHDNDLHSFYQIDTLSVLHSVTEIEICNNPIIQILPRYREYLVFRLPSLQVINSQRIEDEERLLAMRLFSPLKLLWKTPTIRRIKGFCQPIMELSSSSPDNLCTPTTFVQALQLLEGPATASAPQHECRPISTIVQSTIASMDAMKFVDESWTTMVKDLVVDTLGGSRAPASNSTSTDANRNTPEI